MWTAVIAGVDASRAIELRACLQQTGLISSVQERDLKLQPESSSEERLTTADVVLLTLSENPELELTFAAELRRTNPNVRIIACSMTKPSSELLLQAMRHGVQEVLSYPLSATVMKQSLTRFDTSTNENAETFPSKLILVMGSKGGVGTSTVAVNLSVQLAQLTQQGVVLLDFARPIGHASLMLDLQPRFSLRDAAENLERLDSHFLSGLLTRHKTGVQVLGGFTQLTDWEQIAPLALPGIVNVAQNAFDYVVMDYGSIHSLDWLSAIVLRLARNILVVADVTPPALWALERNLMSLTSIGVEPSLIQILINRSTSRDDEILKNLERRCQRPIFARLPANFHPVSEAMNLGIPLNEKQSNPLVSQFRRLASLYAFSLQGETPPHAPLEESNLGGSFSFIKRRGIGLWTRDKEPQIAAR